MCSVKEPGYIEFNFINNSLLRALAMKKAEGLKMIFSAITEVSFKKM